jgi:glycosyltransferase involved in cell wall biosynthesis
MVTSRHPAVSVVIPTYNWSAALRCAIRSVRLQTMQDFEILVVGDGCTDDSEAVVAEFNDPRIRWHNLARNYGSQWAANNYGNEHAAGEWIAYLGHDDLWYPTHLAAILRAAQHESAEAVTSTMILYGPEGSGMRGIAGVFATGAYGPQDFVPPSAFAHARTLYGDVVHWRDPDSVVLPMDVAFLDEVAAVSGKFAVTHELTCFKFNAAWRRDAYKVKSVAEQQRMLERIESGVDFRQAELLDVLQSVVASRFLAVGKPSTSGVETGSFVRINRRHKGLDSRFDAGALRRIDQPTRFEMTEQGMPFEWHGAEVHPIYGPFRWTGPSPRATIDLPVLFDRDLAIRIHVIATLRPDLVDSIKLSIHEHPLDTHVRRDGPTLLLEAKVRRADLASTDRDFGVTIDAGAVARVCDVGIGTDRRWLGLAVNWIELEPLNLTAGRAIATSRACTPRSAKVCKWTARVATRILGWPRRQSRGRE